MHPSSKDGLDEFLSQCKFAPACDHRRTRRCAHLPRPRSVPCCSLVSPRRLLVPPRWSHSGPHASPHRLTGWTGCVARSLGVLVSSAVVWLRPWSVRRDGFLRQNGQAAQAGIHQQEVRRRATRPHTHTRARTAGSALAAEAGVRVACRLSFRVSSRLWSSVPLPLVGV